MNRGSTPCLPATFLKRLTRRNLAQAASRDARTAVGIFLRAGIGSVRRISRRPEGEDVIRDAAAMQRTMNRLRGGALIPRGVYRFARHEEADEWMIRTIAATHRA